MHALRGEHRCAKTRERLPNVKGPGRRDDDFCQERAPVRIKEVIQRTTELVIAQVFHLLVSKAVNDGENPRITYFPRISGPIS